MANNQDVHRYQSHNNTPAISIITHITWSIQYIIKLWYAVSVHLLYDIDDMKRFDISALIYSRWYGLYWFF